MTVVAGETQPFSSSSSLRDVNYRFSLSSSHLRNSMNELSSWFDRFFFLPLDFENFGMECVLVCMASKYDFY